MDRSGPAARRVAATLRHVLGGDAEDVAPAGGALARAPTAGSAPLLTPADVPALTRLLDHDNHEMRDAMKAFMKADLFLPVRITQQRGARPATPAFALDSASL
jgi:hypothetical protein